jgi:hypothetical protein
MKVTAARLALMLRIGKVSGSKARKAGYPHRGYLYLLQETVRIIPQSTTLPLPSTSSSVRFSSLIVPPLEILTASLNKP